MFCKYCGEQLPDDAAFCAQCGKDLRPQKAPMEKVSVEKIPAGKSFLLSLPFVLMVFILFEPEVAYLIRNMLRLTIADAYQVADPVAAALILPLGIHFLKIHIRTYRWSDAAVLFCFVFVVSRSYSIWLRFLPATGNFEAYLTAILYINLTSRLRLSCVWAAAGLLLLGLGRKGWRPRKKHYLLLAAALAVSALAALGLSVYVSFHPLYKDPYYAAAGRMGLIWSAFSWLGNLAALTVFWRLGTGEIGPGAASAAFLSIPVAETLLIPFFLTVLHWGVLSVVLVTSLNGIFCILITRLAVRVRRNMTVGP